MTRASTPFRGSVAVALLVGSSLWLGCGDDAFERVIVSPILGASDGGHPGNGSTDDACGNGRVEGAEECDDGNTDPRDGCDRLCRLEGCGNGRFDPGEECDDGNTDPRDGCDRLCHLEGCGNGKVEPAEECDDGNVEPRDGCDRLCRLEGCGNGRFDPDEECDDGNTDSRDGCDRLCRLEPGCGNGRVDANEECDDGNLEAGDGCAPDCDLEPPVCGDGELDEGEECDDGNLEPGDGCDDVCLAERCGDSRLSAGEECDPPVAGVCTTECLLALPNCGDGEVQEDDGEGCDDGNDTRGDGCNACRLECGNERVETDIGEQCEPVYAPTRCDPETCRYEPACGDGLHQPEAGEQCDLGAIPVPQGKTCTDCRLTDIPPDGPDGGTQPPACAPATALIVNGQFDSDVSGWVPQTRITAEREPNDGGSERGSLKLTFAPHPTVSDTGLEVSGVQQCVAVTGATEYEFRGLFRVRTDLALVKAQMRVIEFDSADCTGAQERISGLALGSVPGPFWIPYERPITTAPGKRSMLLILSVSKPRNLEAVMLWDDLTLRRAGASHLCGDCDISVAGGETCDDGNQDPGDGCNQRCELEVCGNGVVDLPESCDDGDFVFGGSEDRCTSGCREKSACEDCLSAQCTAQVQACYELEGEAAAGPGAGIARPALCDDLRACVRETGCAGPTAIARAATFGQVPDPTAPGADMVGRLEHCYCGTADEDCFEPDMANGACKTQVEAALESTDPLEVLRRIGGAAEGYPIFAAMEDLLICEGVLVINAGGGFARCTAECAVESACGDGQLQDRTFEFAQTLRYFETDENGRVRAVDCRNDLTYSQRGCWVEECEDGNQVDGDGCDATCFAEACGNGRLQTGEECDDANQVPGDGCDASCIAEFECGDGVVVEPFEQCDPPNSGPLCSQAEYASDPSQCGCDAHCSRKVCGDGVVQEPEQCDPPGPACTAECTRSEDPCVSCLRLIDQDVAVEQGIPCAAEWFLDGTEEIAPEILELGCQNEPACYELLLCFLESQCIDEGGLGACYCGDDVEVGVCIAATFMPMGACSEEIVAAFDAQFGSPPVSNAEVFDNGLILSAAPGRYASLWAANQLADACHRSESRPPSTGELITLSGRPNDAESCMNTCLP